MSENAFGGGSHIRLPKVLREQDDAGAIDTLQEYFTRPVVKTGYLRSGAHWDNWDPSGQRTADANRFTADDLVAVTFLSVQVPAHAAWLLLGELREPMTELLQKIGPDRDLVEESEPMTSTSPAWELETALWAVHGIGRTIASKLIARKRPRLFPIYDEVVGRELGTKAAHFEPIRQALRADDGALHRRLLDLRDQAGLDESIPALRVLDVLAWMQGKHYRPMS
ncbi:MAG: DUF6308 family protein [Gordonia sp. (in: high G+C Gram-positive bacteria)]|uniref:DUF6308 family protein n=1 Tax=Gordonia sp. (in: high G+C Gram-positive bacteria) TaxID=84139 RepID=UPI003C76B567